MSSSDIFQSASTSTSDETNNSDESDTAELTRNDLFALNYEQNCNRLDSIFNLKGVTFRTFNDSRVHFYFIPSNVFENIAKKVRFYCLLWHDGKYWRVKKDSFPVECKQLIYNLFWNEKYFIITDENLHGVIGDIHDILIEWSLKHHNYRADKYERFINNEIDDLDLDEDDIELFLTETQKEDLDRKRWNILNRMIPPAPKTRKTRRVLHVT